MRGDNILLEVRDLRKYFDVTDGVLGRVKLRAVSGISFALLRGEVLGLVGESGSGKSTAGRTLLHLYPPSGGEVIFDGERIDSGASIARLRRRCAMVFQDPYSSLNPRMTVADIIAEPLDIHKLYSSAAERREKVLSLLTEVGLSPEHASRYAHEFSGGQRQRIGIARAISGGPELIVADEPVSALDVSVQADIINMFERLRDTLGLTYIFIAHDLLVVRHISDRIAVMYLGKIVELAATEELFSKPLHPYTKILLSAVPIPDPKEAAKAVRITPTGEIPSPLNIPGGCPFHTRCPYVRDVCRNATPVYREFERGHFAACHRVEEIN